MLAATKDDPVALSKNSVAKYDDKDLNNSVKNVVEVAADPEALINDILPIVAEAEVKSEAVVVAKAVAPCTFKLAVCVVDPRVVSPAVNLEAEVVANVLVPKTFNVLVAVILPATNTDPVALSKNKVDT